MTTMFHFTVDRNGRVVIPADVRLAFHLQPGQKGIGTITDNEVRLRSLEATVRQIQEYNQQFMTPDERVSDQLIADRRAEAAREAAEATAFGGIARE